MEIDTRQGKGSQADPGARPRVVIWLIAVAALLTPLIAMQFTSEVNWTLFDFLVFGAMLLFVCGAYELLSRLTGSRAYRLGLGIALLGAFFLVWANLAVGIIGSEANPINRLFFVVPLVGLIAAFIGRFTARGMLRALVVTAMTQVGVSLVALVGGWGETWLFTAVYVVLWLTSAGLFAVAAREEGRQSG